MADIRRIPTIPKASHEQTVKLLEKLLARAKEGEVVELVILYKRSDGHYASAWTGCESLFTTIGQLQFMVHEQCQRMGVPS